MNRKHWIVGLGALAAASGLALAAESAELEITESSTFSYENAAAEPPPAPKPDPDSWLDGWTGGIELGINGSEGNTTTFNFRAGANATRETSKHLTKASAAYTYTKSEGENTANKANANIRNDWKLGADSRWRLFAQGGIEFDDFQDWNLRLTGYGGVGYQVIKEADMSLVLRAGAGVAKEIGGSRNEVIPEALFGADWDWKIDERQKMFANVDFFPSLSEVGDYRVVAKAGYEVLVNPESKMSLKLGIEDRYQNPESGAGKKKNDLDYFALLVWAF